MSACSKVQESDIATHVLIESSGYDVQFQDTIKRRLNRTRVIEGDQVEWRLFEKDVKIKILKVTGSVIDQTKTHFEFQTVKQKNLKVDTTNIYMTSLKDIISSSTENSILFEKMGIPVSKSILIHGVSGVGKTRLVNTVADALGYYVHEVSGLELLSYDDEEYDYPEFKNYNLLSVVVDRCIESKQPSIVLIKELDAFGVTSEKVLKILDILSYKVNALNHHPVFIIGLAQEIKVLPDILKRTDIFIQHMAIPIPTLPQRKVIITQLLREIKLNGITDDNIDHYSTEISKRTSGYVARDLKQLIRQAQLKSQRQPKDLADQLAQLQLTDDPWRPIEYALETSRPSQRTELESTLPSRSWKEIGGYRRLIDKIRQAVLLPLEKPQVFQTLGIKPPSGLLLYGPSGCGKTVFVQALISESNMNVISIRGPEIFSKYLGETEQKIRNLFSAAKRISPCIIFIDEMDAIGTKRGFDMGEGSGGVNERVLSTLLNEMDGVEGRQGVVVIGCTNRPDQIDDAILRPGRLDQLIYVGLPTLEDRLEIIQTFASKLSIDTMDLNQLAKETEFCSGADLENLFREAGTLALREDINTSKIKYSHIESVIVPICERAENLILEGKLDLYEKFLHDHS